MFRILLILAAGILFGRIFRNNRIVSKSGNAATCIIWAMLFFFFFYIGTNSEITSDILNIGKEALVLSIAGIAGSVILSCSAYRIITKKKK